MQEETKLNQLKSQLDAAILERDQLSARVQELEAEREERENQEPVAWAFDYDQIQDGQIVDSGLIIEAGNDKPTNYPGQQWFPLFTRPVPARSLSDEDIEPLADRFESYVGAEWRFNYSGFAYTIEQFLKE